MELTAFGERGCGGIASVNRHRMDATWVCDEVSQVQEQNNDGC